MRTSRRRFVAAAGAAFLAGCSGADDSGPEPDGTVTPVDVPPSEGDVLEAVESIPVPGVPAGPVVSASHREAVVTHVESRIAAAEAAVAAADGVTLSDIDRLDNEEAPFEACRSQLREYDEAPGRLEFRRVARTFDDVGTVFGYAQAVTGDLDADGVRTAAESVAATHSDLVGGIEYRLASPVAEFLPTMEAAEGALDRAADHRLSTDPFGPAGEDPTPDAIADAWRTVAAFELETTNAAGYLETALDPATPPRADAITGEVGSHLEALAALDVPRRVDGRPVPSRIRTVLSSVRSHRSEILAAADPAKPETARRVELLLDALRIRGQLEAYNVAGEATFTRLDGEGFPTDRVIPAKRTAIDRIETLAAAPALERHLGGLAVDMVKYGDRLQAGQGTDPVATAHFMYVAAGEYVDRALDRGGPLAAALEPTRSDNS